MVSFPKTPYIDNHHFSIIVLFLQIPHICVLLSMIKYELFPFCFSFFFRQGLTIGQANMEFTGWH